MKLAPQTDHQTKNNIQTSATSSNHPTIRASAEENYKNQKKLNIDKLHSKTYDKTRVNENSSNEERDPLDKDDEEFE